MTILKEEEQLTTAIGTPDQGPIDGAKVKQEGKGTGNDKTSSLQAYKPNERKIKQEDPDEAEMALGDYETPEFGEDFVQVDGEHIHVTAYFGEEWKQSIVSPGVRLGVYIGDAYNHTARSSCR